MTGTEKQIKWAEDIIKKANIVIEKFNLENIRKEFAAHDDAKWYIENYKFCTNTVRHKYDMFKIWAELINAETVIVDANLKAEGMKARARREITHEIWAPYHEIEETCTKENIDPEELEMFR